MIWLTTGIWLCGLGALACAIFSALLLRQNRRATQVLTAQLNSLGDTHMMGFEALTMDLDRLKARVAELEAYTLAHAPPTTMDLKR